MSREFDVPESQAVRSLMDAGVAATDPDLFEYESTDLTAVFTVPTGYRLETIDLEKLRAPYRPGPLRKSGTYTVRDVGSFLAYYAKHAEQAAEIWVAPTAVTAVLDAHQDVHGGACWEDHRLQLVLTHSVEWRRWAGISGKLHSQQAFAEFLDEAAGDVVNPDMATILEIAQSLEATTKVEFESAYRTTDGQRAFRYKETTTAKAGQKGSLEIPDRIVLSLRIFEGLDHLDLTARFRYRLTGEQLSLGIIIDRIPEVLEKALVDVTSIITDQIDRGTVLIGAPPAAGWASS